MTPPKKKKQFPAAKLILGVLALAAIGYGMYNIYPPLGPATVGILVWIDISR